MLKFIILPSRGFATFPNKYQLQYEAAYDKINQVRDSANSPSFLFP